MKFVETLLDKNIILNKSDNLKFSINKPKYKQTILNFKETGVHGSQGFNGYFKIIKTNNYKLYYREKQNNREGLILAQSNDGINFNKITNISQMKENICIQDNVHNFYPNYIENKKKYIATSGTEKKKQGLFLYESNNGIHWNKISKIINVNDILPGWIHKNHYDTHNTVFYNKFDDYYYLYIRNNQSHVPVRYVQYTKTKDFKTFTKMKNIKINNYNNEDIYVFNSFLYPNSNLFISIPSFEAIKMKKLHNKSDIKICNNLIISTNGEDWDIIENNLFNLNNSENSVMMCCDIVTSIDNNELYFYLHNFNHLFLPEETYNIQLYTLELNRLNIIECLNNGFLIAKIHNLIDSNIEINFKTFDNGWIEVILIDSNNNEILQSKKLIGDCLNKNIDWTQNIKVINNNNYFIKFNMFNCILYSFNYNK